MAPTSSTLTFRLGLLLALFLLAFDSLSFRVRDLLSVSVSASVCLSLSLFLLAFTPNASIVLMTHLVRCKSEVKVFLNRGCNQLGVTSRF